MATRKRTTQTPTDPAQLGAGTDAIYGTPNPAAESEAAVVEPRRTIPDEELLKIVAACISEAQEARKDRLALNTRNWNMYYGRQDWSHKTEGQSTEVLPKVGQAVEQVCAFVKRALTQFGDWFAITVPKSGPLNDDQARNLLKHYLDRILIGHNKFSTFSTICGNCVKSGLLESLLIVKIHGQKVPEPVYVVDPKDKDKLIRKIRMVWRPRMDIIPSEDYYPDHTGRNLYEVHRIERDLVDVQESARQGIYDMAAVNAITEDFSRDNDRDRRRASQRNQKEATPPAFRKRVVIDEFYGTLIDREGNVIYENGVCAIANQKYVIRKPEPNPYWHGRCPILAIPLIQVPFTVWGRALFDHASSLNIALNELFNLMLDGGIAEVWGVRQVRTDWLADPRQISGGIPQVATLAINADVPINGKVVENVTTGAVPAEAMNMFQLADREFQAAALVNDIRLGFLPPRQVKACVPMNSEALTRTGWKFYGDLKIGDEILAFDPKRKECVWTPIQNLYFHSDAEVFEYGNRTFKAQCTDNHKWVTRARWKMFDKNYENEPFELKPLDEWETEASLWQVAKSPEGPGIGALTVWQMMQRPNMPEMVLQMTSPERQAFIIGVLAGEGTISSTKGNGHVCMAQNPGPVLDAFRLACTLEGIATNEYNPHRNDGSRKYIKCHRVSLKHRPFRTVHNFKKNSLGFQPVWCPTTEYKTWVMRQGMTITITGNTEVVESSTNSAVMVDSFASDTEREFIDEALLMTFLNIMQNADDLGADEIIEQIGASAAFDLANMSAAQRFAIYGRATKVKTSGLSATLARTRDFQKLMALMQGIGTNPVLLQAFMSRMSPDKILDFVMKSLNIDPTAIENTPEEQQQVEQRMAQVAQMAQITGQTGQQASPQPGMADTQSEIAQNANPTGGIPQS